MEMRAMEEPPYTVFFSLRLRRPAKRPDWLLIWHALAGQETCVFVQTRSDCTTKWDLGKSAAPLAIQCLKTIAHATDRAQMDR